VKAPPTPPYHHWQSEMIKYVTQSQHAAFKSQTLGRLQQFKSRGVDVQPLQMSTLKAAKHVPDGSLDFIYVTPGTTIAACRRT